MDAAIASAPEPLALAGTSFGQEHFGGCELGDKRLTKRAVVTADALLRHPDGTLPAKLATPELLGFYDFANNPKVTHDNVLATHVQHTRRLMEQCDGVVLVNHEALGLVGQIVQARRNVPRNESVTASRTHPQRESRLWPMGVERVGRPPAGATWVNLMDRGGDSFESLDRQQSLGQFYLVRSRTNRNVRVRDAAGRWIKRKLHTWARTLPPLLGTRTVEVQANATQRARTATVRVAAGPVELAVPKIKYGEHVTIAMLSVVAVQLLRLRDLSRRSDADAIPATDVIDQDYVEGLSLWRWREARMNLSVKEFLYALARKGGHLGRPSDRPPGWLVLWRGWLALQPLVEGLRLARLKRSG